MLPPSGVQFELRSGSSRAVLTEVGATLRLLELAGEPAVLSFAESALCSDGRGQLLAPWPNRLEDGRYGFGGREGVAAWNEPERRNAIHGLLRWCPFSARSVTEASVVLETVLTPQPAYPWRLGVALAYTLAERSLSVRLAATNESDRTAPFGAGFHPYLLAEGGVEEAAVRLRAGTHLVADERGLPRASEPIGDFRPAAKLLSGAPFGATVLDDCFTDLERDDGWWTVAFRPHATADRTIAVRGDAAFGYVMIYSADQLAEGERRRAIAIEPMTCPPNALRSGEALIEIAAGSTFEAGFSISLEG